MADYTLAIKIDDSDLNKAIQKLQAVFKNINIQGTGGSSSGGGSTAQKESQETKTHRTRSIKAFDKIRDVLGKMDKKQMALTGMSFGIGAMVGSLADISGILGSSLKMLTTGIMLMLKPIADFIGLLFRPIMVLFLQYVVLPFYKHVYPWFTKWGAEIGKAIATWPEKLINILEKIFNIDFDGDGDIGESDNDTISGTEKLDDALKDIYDKIFEAGRKAGDAVYGAGKWLGDQIRNAGKWVGDQIFGAGKWLGDLIFGAGAALGEAWNATVLWIKTNMIKPLEDAWKTFTNWIDSGIQQVSEGWDNLVDWFSNVLNLEALTEHWNNFAGFFAGVAEGVSSFVTRGWLNFTNFILKIGGDANTWLVERWNEMTKFMSIIASDAGGWVNERWKELTSWISNIGNAAGGWLATLWENVESFFLNLAAGVKAIWDKITSLWTKITSWTPPSSGGGGGGGGNNNHSGGKEGGQVTGGLHATGGIISEPIVGRGLYSGNRQVIGEAGPEMIIPLSELNKGGGVGGGRPIVINVTVTNQAQLDALIAKVKQELLIEQRRTSVI